MLRRVFAISLVFVLSVALTVCLFYAPGGITGGIALLLMLAIAFAHRATRPRPLDNTCRACGYDLTGLDPIGLCPECSEPYTERPPLEDILRERLEARDRSAAAARDDAG